jgi:hypothetical protein
MWVKGVSGGLGLCHFPAKKGGMGEEVRILVLISPIS